MKKMFAALMVTLWVTTVVFAGGGEYPLTGVAGIPTGQQEPVQVQAPPAPVGDQGGVRRDYVPPEPEAPSNEFRTETVVVNGRQVIVRGDHVYVSGQGLVSAKFKKSTSASTPRRTSRGHYHQRRYYTSKGYSSNLAQLWAGIRELGRRISNLETAMVTVKGWISDLQARMTGVEARLDSLEKVQTLPAPPVPGAQNPVNDGEKSVPPAKDTTPPEGESAPNQAAPKPELSAEDIAKAIAGAIPKPATAEEIAEAVKGAIPAPPSAQEIADAMQQTTTLPVDAIIKGVKAGLPAPVVGAPDRSIKPFVGLLAILLLGLLVIGFGILSKIPAPINYILIGDVLRKVLLEEPKDGLPVPPESVPAPEEPKPEDGLPAPIGAAPTADEDGDPVPDITPFWDPTADEGEDPVPDTPPSGDPTAEDGEGNPFIK